MKISSHNDVLVNCSISSTKIALITIIIISSPVVLTFVLKTFADRVQLAPTVDLA